MLGSIRGVTDSTGTLSGSTSYEAFGAVRSQTGASLSLGFTGQLTDPAAGFLDLRARELDPTLGRFLSADSVQPNAPGSQGYNRYAYVANNPTTWVDSSGHLAGFAPVALVDACVLTPSCAAGLELGAEEVAVGGLPAIGGWPIIVFALLICALDFTAEVQTGHSLTGGCFGLAMVYQHLMDQFGSPSASGAYTGTPRDARDAAASYPGQPSVSDPAADAGIAGYIYKAEWRDTDTGEQVRVRKLTPTEVKNRGLEKEKEAMGSSATDDIYEEVNPRQGSQERRLWLGRGNGPLQSFDVP